MIKLQPSKSKKYRPTYRQWEKLVDETEFTPNSKVSYHSVELINFDTSEVHLITGQRIPFDCVSEKQYIHVVNGGYYEDAPEINDSDRI